jgi:putative transposase
MADELRIGLEELLRKARMEGEAGFLKEGVRVLSQALMELEVEEHIGAGRHERSPVSARVSATATGGGPGPRG